MDQQNGKNSQTFSDATPVPKEPVKPATETDEVMAGTGSETSGVVASNMSQPLQTESIETKNQVNVKQPEPVQQPETFSPQPQPVKEKVIVKKKGRGFFNKTTCCIGGCGGCLILIVILVLLAIFAAPFVADILNKVVNPDIEIPELMDIDITSLEDEINVSIQEGGAQEIEVSEDEFNVLLHNKIMEGSSEDDLSFDMRVDFEDTTAKIFMKFDDWMPWAIFDMKSDETGQIEMTGVKLGPIDIRNVATQIQYDESDTEEFDMTGLIGSSLFREEDDVTIQGVYFEKDLLRVEYVVNSEVNLEE